MSHIAEVATRYTAHGWHVFPVAISKKPLTAHGFQDASADAKQIAEWWKQYPMAQIGIACGASRIAVIDVDVRNGGVEAWARIDPHIATLESRTGSGGKHVIFADPRGEMRNSESRLAKGVDTRGVGGYIIVPPSRNQSGQYTWTSKAKPAELPSILIPAVPPVQVATQTQATLPSVENLSRSTCDFIMQGASVGERNARLFRAACDCAGNGMAQSAAEAVLVAVSGLPVSEAKRTIQSAYAKQRIPARPIRQPRITLATMLTGSFE